MLIAMVGIEHATQGYLISPIPVGQSPPMIALSSYPHCCTKQPRSDVANDISSAQIVIIRPTAEVTVGCQTHLVVDCLGGKTLSMPPLEQTNTFTTQIALLIDSFLLCDVRNRTHKVRVILSTLNNCANRHFMLKPIAPATLRRYGPLI